MHYIIYVFCGASSHPGRRVIAPTRTIQKGVAEVGRRGNGKNHGRGRGKRRLFVLVGEKHVGVGGSGRVGDETTN